MFRNFQIVVKLIKKQSLTIPAAILFIFLLTACNKKKEEAPPNTHTDLQSNGNSIDKTTVNIDEINTVTLNTNISQQQITGKIGDKEVVFIKSDENMLTFITPADLAPGEYPISFVLGNTTYESRIVIENKVVVSDVPARFDQYENYLKAQINKLDSALQVEVDSNLITIEEKNTEVNETRQFISDVLTKVKSMDASKQQSLANFLEVNSTNLENKNLISNARVTSEYNSLLLFKASVLALGGSVWASYIMYSAKQYDKALLSLAGVFVSYKASIYFGKKSRDDLYKPVSVIIDKLSSESQQRKSQVTAQMLTVNNEEPTSIGINIRKASLTNADASNSNSVIQSFFGGFNKLTGYINKINETIEGVNAVIGFLYTTKTVSYLLIPNSPRLGLRPLESSGYISLQGISNSLVQGTLTGVSNNKAKVTFKYSGTSSDDININCKLVYNNGDFSYSEDLSVTIKQPPLEIGQSYAGGIIFYLDETKHHGLVAAPNDQVVGKGWEDPGSWGCHNTAIVGADNPAVGFGKWNTADIVKACSQPIGAAYICSNLVLNGYDDWFLPSKSELDLMYENLHLKGLGNFTADPNNLVGVYWSSTEYPGLESTDAWGRFFVNGISRNYAKGTAYCVRAARAF
ncbi:DUF1566 domain-containing protein [Sporocytophaga myxococcoides]|uniref:DUF1566 domain-containing protein n=1 Tax=Sporocytophaga myxococcoides TaxID=153721 RepID=UPI0003F9110A|nr:DUF1566 domain-containing protein [Sporocytophaga myxococcoides]